MFLDEPSVSGFESSWSHLNFNFAPASLWNSYVTWQEHTYKETCLKINDKQNVRLRSGSIKFKNYFKLLTESFKIYADFESLLKSDRGIDKKIILHTLKNIRNTFGNSGKNTLGSLE